MTLKAIAVDDEFLALKILETYATRTEGITLEKTFTNPTTAIEYLQSNPVDLLFLDIQMPELTGFDLLSQLTHPPMVVFTTARHDYASKAFDLDVLDYLVKPIPFERFEKAVRKAIEYKEFRMSMNHQPGLQQEFIMIKADYKVHKLMLDTITHIEGLSEYVKIHTPEKVFITLAALRDLLTQLPATRFIRVHKSFIVALDHVTSYNYQTVHLKNGKEIPIGRAYKAEFVKAME